MSLIVCDSLNHANRVEVFKLLNILFVAEVEFVFEFVFYDDANLVVVLKQADVLCVAKVECVQEFPKVRCFVLNWLPGNLDLIQFSFCLKFQNLKSTFPWSKSWILNLSF